MSPADLKRILAHVRNVNISQALRANADAKRKKVVRLWKADGLPAAQPEWRFDETRKWRFDYAFPEQQVAVEVQGGIWGKGKPCPVCKQRAAGRHTRGAALKKEWEKLNTAASRGWRILYCAPGEELSGAFLDQLKTAVGRAQD